jgi:predicted ArsR family transcriptional regulator
MSAILGLHVNEINKYLEALEKKGAISPVRRERGVFYERAGKGGR